MNPGVATSTEYYIDTSLKVKRVTLFKFNVIWSSTVHRRYDIMYP